MELVRSFTSCETAKTSSSTLFTVGWSSSRATPASARWLIREVGLSPAKNGPGKSYYNNFGFFIDELRKVNRKWLFKTRTYPYLYLDTDPFTGKAVALNVDISFT